MKPSAYRPGIPERLRILVTNGTGDHLNATFKVAYAAGWSLQELADIIGVSREAVRLRTNKPVPVALLADMERVVPPKPQKPPAPPKPPKPITLVPADKLRELANLQTASAGTTGMTPVGDPKRLAGDKLCELAADVMAEYGVGVTVLSRALGLSAQTLKARLTGRGYYAESPSRPRYRNEQMKPGRPKSSRPSGE